MKCIHCQGKMKRAHAPFHIDRKGHHLSLEAVPAWVCHQCGESYFVEREVKTIQRLLLQLDKQTASLASVA
ncbi:MAG: YgiT-type zinc finger protein [Acidobacteriia bacterium]|nr:YgiT-type zinc finger protein [Terriglobia bacterium]